MYKDHVFCTWMKWIVNEKILSELFIERSTQEMDVMLKKQNRLMIKLRDECKRQAGQIEKVTKKNRSVWARQGYECLTVRKEQSK